MFKNIDKIITKLNLVSTIKLDNIFLNLNNKEIIDFEVFKEHILSSYKSYSIVLNETLSNCIIEDGFKPTDVLSDDFVVEKGTDVFTIYKINLFSTFKNFHSDFLQRVMDLKVIHPNQIQLLREVLDNNPISQTYE